MQASEGCVRSKQNFDNFQSTRCQSDCCLQRNVRILGLYQGDYGSIVQVYFKTFHGNHLCECV